MAVYFFWPGLIISIVLSIFLSVGLTLFLNYSSRKRTAGFEEPEMIKNDEDDTSNKETHPDSKSGGFILIGPFPIIFGSGGVRFDRRGFKWTLLFFTIIVLTFLLLTWAIRL